MTAAATARLVAFFRQSLRPVETAEAQAGGRLGLLSGLRPPRAANAPSAPRD